MFTPVRVDFREMEVVTRSCAVGMDAAVSCQIEESIPTAVIAQDRVTNSISRKSTRTG